MTVEAVDMKMIKEIMMASVAVLISVMAGIATELPGYDDLPTTIGKTVSVVEVQIKEAKTSSKVDGPNTLEVLAQVEGMVAGERIEGEIKGKYEEFHAPWPTKPDFHIDLRQLYGFRTGT